MGSSQPPQPPQPPPAPPRFLTTPAPVYPGFARPLLLAHRGASAWAPENTWPAFELAVQQGADVLELDVHLSRDKEVVVIHDATVDRTTDARGWVQDYTCAQLARMDAGCRFTRADGRHPFAHRGIGVPRLEDILRAFASCGFNIDIKQRDPSMVGAVLRMLERVGPRAVVLTSWHDEVMEQLEAACAPWALGLSKGQVQAVIKGAYIGGLPSYLAPRALQIPWRYRGIPIARRNVITKAHQAGLDVHVWVINTPQRAQTCLERGADGLISDQPATLKAVLESCRMPASPSPPSPSPPSPSPPRTNLQDANPKL